MRKIATPLVLFILLSLLHDTSSAQTYTNRGNEFWVSYQRTNGFSQGNSQEMVIYMATGSQQANVQIQIMGTAFLRNYVVPANSAVQSEFLPKTGADDARLQVAGLFTRGIRITSDVPIVAYAHIYESTNSGATMLIPTSMWGYDYRTVNNRQYYPAAGGIPSATVFNVIAREDSTWVEINPTKNTTNGWSPNGGGQPNGSYLVKLNKGQVFQVLGGVLAGSEGLDLTGTSVKSVTNAQGIKHPIAVFCGSTRTAISCSPTISNVTGDLVIQQVFPSELWGTKYATAPFSNETSLGQLMTSVYRVMVTDTTTVVKRNGIVLPVNTLINKTYYEFQSGTADYITSDKPVLVAQYMASAGNCPNVSTSKGDPEMIFLTPSNGAIPQTSFYRNNKQAISSNYVTLVIPAPGMSTLKIDGVLFSNIPAADKFSYAHPNMPGYIVATKRFVSANVQSRVESNYAFTGYTYGLGSVESYGYNLGVQIDSANLQTIKYNTIAGVAFIDSDKDGIKGASETLYPHVKLKTFRPGVDTFNLYTGNGSFLMYVDSGTYITTAEPDLLYHNAVPATDTSVFSTYFNSDTVNFALQPISSVRDLAISLVPLSAVRPGFKARYRIEYMNKGTDTADAEIVLAKSPMLILDSTSAVPTAVTADSIKWNVSSLLPGTGGSIFLRFNVAAPPQVNNGDTLYTNAHISSAKTDTTANDNTFSLMQIVSGSYDPNDKTESHAGQVLKSALAAGELLHYTIRFQNTGTDTAFNIVIRDTLDTRLDWNTLRMTSASHSYQLVVNDGRCAWSFNNIELVDSNRNEPLSHGYISFSIQPKASVNPGETILNRASIYFDHNLPIQTNTEATTVSQEVLPVRLIAFDATRKQAFNLLQWKTTDQVNLNHFDVQRSMNGRDFETIGNVPADITGNYSYNDKNFQRTINYYRLKMTDADGKFQFSPVRRVNNGDGVDVTLFPNPANDVLHLRIETASARTISLRIMAADGRTALSQQLNMGAGVSTVPVSINTLHPGVYFVRLETTGERAVILRFSRQ